MILLRQDWDMYPGAIIDVKTPNHTFLKYSALLRTMGVKNHAFPLALLNPELQGVDPFSNNLSMEQMAMVAIECRDNPWYYFREVSMAPGRGSPEPVKFRANRGNMAVFWLYFNHITSMLIQIRQTGKSFSVDSLLVYLTNILLSNSNIAILTKDDTLRAFNSERIRDIQSELPFYLIQKTPADIANTEEITFKSLGNAIRLMVPNKSPKAALNIGRGLTVGTFICDEAAFIYNIGITLPAALAAGTAARDSARVNGDPFGTILMTTAGKKDDRDGAFVFNLLSKSAVWTEKFFDAETPEKLYELVCSNSPGGELRVNCTFSHRQLGYTDEWLKQAVKDALVTGEDADRDFFNKWTSGSLASPLSIELLTMIKQSENTTFYTEIAAPYNYALRWHLEESAVSFVMQNDDHVISIDSSDAVGGDDIGMVIRSVKSGAVVAAGNFNETNLITFCEWLMTLFVKYPRLTLVIERRSTGAMIVDYLIMMMLAKNIDPFRRIFNWVVQNKEEHPERYAEVSKELYLRDNAVYTKYKKEFGFSTSSSGATSRNELYSTTLLNAAKYTGDKTKDPIVIEQIMSLTTRNGRVDHRVGGHDDVCIAWLLSGWLLFNGRNLDHYGIKTREVLSESAVRKKEVGTSEDQYDAFVQKQLRQQVEELAEKLRQERDWFISQKIEHKLRAAVAMMKVTDEEKISIDELIRQLKEQKQQAARDRTYNGFRPRSYY